MNSFKFQSNGTSAEGKNFHFANENCPLWGWVGKEEK
jgi:hypothetical protein